MKLGAFGIAALLLFGTWTVPTVDAQKLSFATQSRIGVYATRPSPNDLKPSECAGVTVTNLITGLGDLVGTGGADLILGGPAAQSIRGLGGGDCILGGGGADKILAQGGADVCIGNTSTNFAGCKANFIK